MEGALTQESTPDLTMAVSDLKWKPGNPKGFGAMHKDDPARESLWDSQTHRYRNLSRQHWRLLEDQLQDGGAMDFDCILYLNRRSPPPSAPLTWAAKPVYFIPPDTSPPCVLGSIRYSHPRLPDPCADLGISAYETPTEETMRQIFHRMRALANVVRLYSLSAILLTILGTEDGRVYGNLPGIVAGRSMAYHHREEHWLSGLRFKLFRGGRFRCHHCSGPPSDEKRNAAYPEWGVTADMQEWTPPAPETSPDVADALGVVLRNAAGDVCATAPSHEWAKGSEVVLRPSNDVRYVGRTRERRKELGVVLVNLRRAIQPAFLRAATRTRPATRLLAFADVRVGDKFEVDAGPGGFVDLHCIGKFVDRPRAADEQREAGKGYVLQPVGHSLTEGIEGAPVIDGEDGGVAGFIHLVSGLFAEVLAVDVLIESGWEVLSGVDTGDSS